MTEDKEAIEAIARRVAWGWIFTKPDDVADFRWEMAGEEQKLNAFKVANQILQALTSLGYVKLAEQKLPEIENLTGISAYYQGKYTGGVHAQQDMLSVDSEGCAYRRVKVK